MRSFSKLFLDRIKGQKSRREGVLFFLFLSFLVCFLMSCAAKKVEIPIFEGIDLKEMLAERESVKSLESTFYIEFERDGSIMKGDAILRLTPETMDLQVYSLGFLVAEVISNGDGTRSNPSIDRNKLSMLVDGIRNSFFWWSVKNPGIKDDNDSYLVSNSWRMLFINKKTMMPEKQIIELDDGRQLNVFYEEPALMDGVWFPSKMRIELSRQSVNLKIKTLSIASPRSDPGR